MGLVEIEDRGAVRHIVMNRPEKRNALNGELIQALGESFEDNRGERLAGVAIGGRQPRDEGGLARVGKPDDAHVGQELVPLPEGSSYLGFIFARGDSVMV